MKMLIIEDTLMHQKAAQVQFPEAQVVNYDEAYAALAGADREDFSAILTDLHFKVEKERTIPAAPFDSHFPQNMAALGNQMPFGLAFVLKGVELGVPVALVSDLNHHEDLVTGLLDLFAGCYVGSDGKPFIGYRSRKDDFLDPVRKVENPKFLMLRDTCPKAGDMYWDGTQIVCEPFEEGKGGKLVKDWRVAHKRLMEIMG